VSGREGFTGGPRGPAANRQRVIGDGERPAGAPATPGTDHGAAAVQGRPGATDPERAGGARRGPPYGQAPSGDPGPSLAPQCRR